MNRLPIVSEKNVLKDATRTPSRIIIRYTESAFSSN